jgi:hypothetical protein
LVLRVLKIVFLLAGLRDKKEASITPAPSGFLMDGRKARNKGY